MYRIALGVLALFCALQLSAAPPKKPALAAQYKRWVDQDVVYIITDEERKAFLALNTDDDRENFIDNFWSIRNPLRRSEHNPYKDEHYARIDYANAHFGKDSNTPGWRTDMGRAYILFGAPSSRHPYVGYSQIYPFELWFYENKTNSPNLPAFFYLMFYIDGDIGEYKFYRPYMDGPMKLVRGSQFNSNADVYKFMKPLGGDIAHAILSLVPSEPIDTVNYQPEMGSDILISKIQNFANDPFNVRRLREIRSLRASVSSKLLINDETPLPIETFILADPLGQYWLDYNVPVRDASMGKLVASQVLPIGDSKLSVATSFRLLDAAGAVIIEDEEEQSVGPFGADGVFHPFLLAGRLPVNPGSYTLEFRVIDRVKSRVFTGEKKFTVAPKASVTMSGPVVFSGVKQVTTPDATAPFQYFGAQFLPIADGEQAASDPLRVLFALDVPANPDPALKSYAVEYVIAHLQDRDLRVTMKETIPLNAFRNGHLLKSKTIPLKDLFPGPYRVIVTIRAAEDQPILASASTSIRLGKANDSPLLFLLDSVRRTAVPAGASYIRALEAISSKDQPAAARYMKQALDLNTTNESAARFLVQAYFEAHDFPPIAALYRKVGMKPFEASAELLAQISLSFARTGDRRQAQEILNSARTLFPQNPLLAATAKAESN